MVVAMLIGTAVSRADVLVSNFDASNVLRFADTESNVAYTGSGDPHVLVSSGSSGLTSATGVAQGPDGNFYVSSHDTGQILAFNGKTGASLGIFATLPNDYNPVSGMFDSTAAPAHLQFYNNTLYVSDNFGGRVVTIGLTRNGSGQLQAGAIGATAMGLFAPGGFDFAPNGDMYVSDLASGTVSKVPNGSTTPQTFVAPGTLYGPNGILYANGNVYVADLYGDQIYRFNSSGTVTASAVIPPFDSPPPGNYPSDMMLSRDGQSILLAVLGPDHNSTGSVLKFDLNLNMTGTIASALPASASIALGYQRGDFNFDGHVNAADILAMENALAGLNAFQAANHLSDSLLDALADVNNDGVINSADLQKLLLTLKTGVGSNNAVPEPSTVVLAGFALGALCYIHRRRMKT